MLNSALAVAARFAFGQKILFVLASANSRLVGKRSEIVVGLLAIVNLLSLVGLLPVGSAAGVNDILLPILPVVLADRVSKFIALVNRLVPEPPKNEPAA